MVPALRFYIFIYYGRVLVQMCCNTIFYKCNGVLQSAGTSVLMFYPVQSCTGVLVCWHQCVNVLLYTVLYKCICVLVQVC